MVGAVFAISADAWRDLPQIVTDALVEGHRGRRGRWSTGSIRLVIVHHPVVQPADVSARSGPLCQDLARQFGASGSQQGRDRRSWCLCQRRSVAVGLAVAEEMSRPRCRGRGRRWDRRRVRRVVRLVRSTSWRLSRSMRMRRMGRRVRSCAERVCIRRM